MLNAREQDIFKIYLKGLRIRPNPLLDEPQGWSKHFVDHDAEIIITLKGDGTVTMRVHREGAGSDSYVTSLRGIMREILFLFGVDPEIIIEKEPHDHQNSHSGRD